MDVNTLDPKAQEALNRLYTASSYTENASMVHAWANDTAIRPELTLEQKGLISKIWKLHEKHDIDYNAEEVTPNGIITWSLPSRPLDAALSTNNTVLALWMLEKKDITVDHTGCTGETVLHFLMKGIIKSLKVDRGVTQDHAQILKKLIARGADINHSCSFFRYNPVAVYMGTVAEMGVPFSAPLLQLFFKHGAHILTKKEDASCNLLQVALDKSIDASYALKWVLTLLYEKSKCLKESFLSLKYLRAFKQLETKRAFEKSAKIPRPLSRMIIEMAVEHDILEDIRSSLKEKEYCLSVSQRVQKSKEFRTSTELLTIFSLAFWDRPLGECRDDLESIMPRSFSKYT
jgi:hypothetical protein